MPSQSACSHLLLPLKTEHQLAPPDVVLRQALAARWKEQVRGSQPTQNRHSATKWSLNALRRPKLLPSYALHYCHMLADSLMASILRELSRHF